LDDEPISRDRLFWRLVRGGLASPEFASTVDAENVRSKVECLVRDGLVVTSTAANVNMNRVDVG
jgi:hypothetical protein